VLLVELKNHSQYFAMKCLKKDVILEDDDTEVIFKNSFKIKKKLIFSALLSKEKYLFYPVNALSCVNFLLVFNLMNTSFL